MDAIPELDKNGLRKFGFTFGGIIAALFGLIIPWLFGLEYRYWPWAVLVFFLLWGMVWPASIKPFYKLWMRFGLLLNAVMSRLILGIVFFLVVLPTGLIIRLKGKDPMKRNLSPNIDSYRTKSEQTETNRMEKPF